MTAPADIGARVGTDIPRRVPARRARLFAVAGAVVAVAITLTVVLSRVQRAPPVVDRATVWIDTVKRGPMIRDVQGVGSLVPEQVRWLTATTAARVTEVRARSGAVVAGSDVVVVLDNPDLVLASLEADRQQTAAEAELVKLTARTRNERLAQEASVVGLSADAMESDRRAQADDELARRGFLSPLEMAQSRGRAEALGGRVSLENKRLGALDQQAGAELASQKAQVERLRSIAAFRHHQVGELSVRAGDGGVLQDVPVQIGQWVTPGTVLGKVARPDKLKAELRVSETLAKDVAIGQSVTVDTRNGLAAGKVIRIDGAVQAGTVKIDVGFDAPLPPGARPDISVDGRVEIESIPDTLYLARPPTLQPESGATVFRVTGDEATRIPVRLGRVSVKNIQVTGGLAAGDAVIVSDTTAWSQVDRIRLK
jgi:HlyD family secretion protein